MRKAVCNAIHIEFSTIKGKTKEPGSSGVKRSALLKKARAF